MHMPVLKETKRSIKNTSKRWAASGNQVHLSDQHKEALRHTKNFQNRLSGISKAANVSFTKRQVNVVAQSPALQVAVRVQENIISIQDTHDALLGAFRAVVQVSEAIGHIFRVYEQQFSAIAEVANNIGRTVKTVDEWHSQIVERGSLLGHQLQVVGENFKLIVESISLQSPSANPTIYPVRATYRETSVSIRLERDQVEEIAELAARRVLGKLEEKYFAHPKELSGQSLIAPAAGLQASSQSSPIPAEQKIVRWEGLVIDFQRSVLRYKDHAAIEIAPGLQTIKWLVCVIHKNGEVAEYVEVALAIGHISEKQNKTNNEVGRNVQLVKKKVITLLQEAGMTKQEIDQMILTKRGFGFAMRKLVAAQKPQK